METTLVYFNWWLNKGNVVHTHSGTLFSHKRIKFCHFGDCHVKRNKPGTNRQVPPDSTHM
jgi:hypothetical protein